MRLTKQEMDEYNHIQDLWAVRKATSKHIHTRARNRTAPHETVFPL